MGVRLDVEGGSKIGLDLPGSSWAREFFPAIREVVSKHYPATLELMTGDGSVSDMRALAAEMRAIAKLLPSAPLPYAEYADKIAALANLAQSKNTTLVWS